MIRGIFILITVFAVLLALQSSNLSENQTVTGFFLPPGFTTNTVTPNLDLNRPQNYTFTHLGSLKSLYVSGSIKGDGYANIYLLAGGKRFLVADRASMTSNPPVKNEYSFRNVCLETCDINVADRFYTIIFDVSPTVQLKIIAIEYIRQPGTTPSPTTPPKPPKPIVGKGKLLNPSFEEVSNGVPLKWHYSTYRFDNSDDEPWNTELWKIDESYSGDVGLLYNYSLQVQNPRFMKSEIIAINGGDHILSFYTKPDITLYPYLQGQGRDDSPFVVEIFTFAGNGRLMEDVAAYIDKTNVWQRHGDATRADINVANVENGWKRLDLLLHLSPAARYAQIYFLPDNHTFFSGTVRLDDITFEAV